MAKSAGNTSGGMGVPRLPPPPKPLKPVPSNVQGTVRGGNSPKVGVNTSVRFVTPKVTPMTTPGSSALFPGQPNKPPMSFPPVAPPSSSTPPARPPKGNNGLHLGYGASPAKGGTPPGKGGTPPGQNNPNKGK